MQAQDAAKKQLIGAMKELKTLRKDLASGKLTAQDKSVAAAMNKYLGANMGGSAEAIDRLMGAATSMLGMLNSSMPAQFGGNNPSYARADHGQLTLFTRFFPNPLNASASAQRAQVMAHELAHHGMGLNDIGIDYDSISTGPYGDRNAATRALYWPDRTWDNPDSLTFALGFHRTDGDFP